MPIVLSILPRVGGGLRSAGSSTFTSAKSVRRISETGQAVVLTLVDTAAAELQNLVEPKVDHEFSSGSIKSNPSLSSDNQTRQSEHSTSQILSSPIVDEATEQSNDTDPSGSEKEALLPKNISEETSPEVVVIVRAEQRANTDELELRVEESASQMSNELPKIDDAFTTAPELNDTAARAQLIGGSRDESAAIILDGLVSSGPTDPHEDIPSFSEWAQKRLEEAEKKKSEYCRFRISDSLILRLQDFAHGCPFALQLIRTSPCRCRAVQDEA